MRDYLNSYEKEKILFAIKLYDVVDEIIEEFSKRGNLTKTEQKQLKLSFTYGSKALQEMIARLNPQAYKTMMKSIDNSNVILLNDFLRDTYLKRKSKDADEGYENSKDYYNLVELIMDKSCKDCTEKDVECELYRHFEDNMIIDMDYCYGKCKYAYPSKK